MRTDAHAHNCLLTLRMCFLGPEAVDETGVLDEEEVDAATRIVGPGFISLSVLIWSVSVPLCGQSKLSMESMGSVDLAPYDRSRHASITTLISSVRSRL